MGVVVVFQLMFACLGARYEAANMEWLWSEYQQSNFMCRDNEASVHGLWYCFNGNFVVHYFCISFFA